MDALWAYLGSVLTTGAVVWLARTWVGARIKGEVNAVYARELETHRSELRAENDRELERLRARIDQERLLQSVATAAFSSAHKAAAERTLQAVGQLWNVTIQSSRLAGKLMLLLDIHAREELVTALDNPQREESIGKPTDEQITGLLNLWEPVEGLRPFIDEPLWALFVGYRTLLGRILVNLKMGREEGRLRFWLDDRNVRSLLASMVGSEDFQRIERTRIGGITEARRTVELTIADAARRAISGEAASERALEHAKQVLRKAAEAEQTDSLEQSRRAPAASEP